jgi:CDP-diacylglycerol--glycerol-3-phosphate 3-phosphatidyltransferase
LIELRVRGSVERVTDPIGRFLGRLGFTPTSLTLIGLALSLVGAALIATERLVLGGWIAAAGAILDGLDGAVARATGRAGPSGALVDTVADRVGEIAIFSALAYAVADTPLYVILCGLSLGGSLLVPFIRAKAEGFGVEGRGGWMGRSERVILFTAGLVFGFVGPMLWAMTVLTWITVGQRFVLTWQRLHLED